eukprot:464163_1
MLDDAFDEKKECQPNMFNFGVKFNYNIEATDIEGIIVSKLYASFKEELLQNNVVCLNIAQFGSEMRKALVHFSSHHKQLHYARMSADQILALMIYCNYDVIQYEFSRTFRQNTETHNQFYHLGKHLTSCMQFGPDPRTGKIDGFYHGMSALVFPQVIGDSFLLDRDDQRRGLEINCPLSTSSSFAVAVNFADINDGLVIELRRMHFSHSTYYSVEWLSDYPNEHEYLFIRTRLEIVNISEFRTGFEYYSILKALQFIQTLFENMDMKRELKTIRKLAFQIIE